MFFEDLILNLSNLQVLNLDYKSVTEKRESWYDMAMDEKISMHTPGVKSLGLRSYDFGSRRIRSLPFRLECYHLQRLSLVKCRNTMWSRKYWQALSSEMKVFEIIDPIHPRRFLPLAEERIKPRYLLTVLERFNNLEFLNVQNIRSQIYDVVLSLEYCGESLRTLRLHDFEESALNTLYELVRESTLNGFWYNQKKPLCLEVHFLKFLSKTCPNLERLSMNMSWNGLCYRRFSVTDWVRDSVYMKKTDILQELKQDPTPPNFHAICSFQFLRHLTIVAPSLGPLGPHFALNVACNVWGPRLQTLELIVSSIGRPGFISPSIDTGIEDAEKHPHWCITRKSSSNSGYVRPEDLLIVNKKRLSP